MCGIFGYVNYATPKTRQFIIDALISGLRRLEYRGYDSAGIALDDDSGMPLIYKEKGNIDQLVKYVEFAVSSRTGLTQADSLMRKLANIM